MFTFTKIVIIRLKIAQFNLFIHKNHFQSAHSDHFPGLYKIFYNPNKPGITEFIIRIDYYIDQLNLNLWLLFLNETQMYNIILYH